MSERGETASEALARARRHANLAVSEALAAARALLDAAAIAASGQPARANATLGALAANLDQWSERWREGSLARGPLVDALLDGVDEEIRRWAARAAHDPEARTVLRTFLSLREVLFEFGLRRDAADESSEPAGERPRRRPRRPGRGRPQPSRPRVQRVDVQG